MDLRRYNLCIVILHYSKEAWNTFQWAYKLKIYEGSHGNCDHAHASSLVAFPDKTRLSLHFRERATSYITGVRE